MGYRRFLAYCLIMGSLSACDTPLISVTHVDTVRAPNTPYEGIEAPPPVEYRSYPPTCPGGQACPPDLSQPPPPHPYASEYAYPQGYYAQAPRPDYQSVQDQNGRTYYCYRPTIPVRVEEPTKKLGFGLSTVKFSIKCRHPRTGELTDATEDIVPLAPPY